MTRARVLCADDDPAVCELLQEELSEAGFDITIVGDGERALSRILQEPPDVIICDVSMPRLGGKELRERLNALGPAYRDIPFIFLTAYCDHKKIIEGRRLGADDYLGKPIDFELLAAILEQHTRRRPEEGAGGRALPSLTVRELEVLTWAARGKSSSHIGELIGITERTVNFHAENAAAKLGVATRTQAAVKASRLGLIDP